MMAFMLGTIVSDEGVPLGVIRTDALRRGRVRLPPQALEVGPAEAESRKRRRTGP